MIFCDNWSLLMCWVTLCFPVRVSSHNLSAKWLHIYYKSSQKHFGTYNLLVCKVSIKSPKYSKPFQVFLVVFDLWNDLLLLLLLLFNKVIYKEINFEGQYKYFTLFQLYWHRAFLSKFKHKKLYFPSLNHTKIVSK